MSETMIKVEWLNKRNTILRIEYVPGYTLHDYNDLMVRVMGMIEHNPATIIYLNIYPAGTKMPDGNIINTALRVTTNFEIQAMVIVHETDETELYNKALAKSFGFEEGKNVWFFRDETEARKSAQMLDKRLNPQHENQPLDHNIPHD